MNATMLPARLCTAPISGGQRASARGHETSRRSGAAIGDIVRDNLGG